MNDYWSFLVTKQDGTENLVYLFRNKEDNTWSFVNITKGHICPCRFDTEDDAFKDLRRYKMKGKILNYEAVHHHKEGL